MTEPYFKFIDCIDRNMRYINMSIFAINTVFKHCSFRNCKIHGNNIQFEGCLIDCDTLIDGYKIIITPFET